MSMIALLDNTVLSNCALVGRFDLPSVTWGRACVMTLEVFAEYQAGVSSGQLPANEWEEVQRVILTEPEQRIADDLASILGAGERSCIAVAITRGGIVVSDDRKARQIAGRYNVSVSGTIGLLIASVRKHLMTVHEGNVVLSDMIAHGYRSPVATLDELFA